MRPAIIFLLISLSAALWFSSFRTRFWPVVGPRDFHQQRLRQDDTLAMDDTDRNLMWFVHVSDIHINKFPEHVRRIERFREFASIVPKAVNPEFFIVTGDLTDAKDKTRVKSEQYEEEWKIYRGILEEFGLNKPGYFNEVRGNHDAFNVLSLDSESNFFANYSNAGHPSYSLVKEKPFGKYSFVAIDACPNPGASRPFNFFGTLDTKDMDDLGAALHEFSAQKHNHTIVFGHYPLVTISDSYTSSGESLSDLAQHFSVYLCGHLHTAMGHSQRLYARHWEGFLELEVADLGWTKEYRVFVVDHDLLSFTDTSLYQWPVVVISNPKDASILAPEREPVHRIATSSHIRFLAFSPDEIVSTKIEIDGLEHPAPVTRAIQLSDTNPPLYVSKWNPDALPPGVHTIAITATDKLGNTVTKTQKFSVDGTTVPLFGLGTLLLSLNFNFLCKLGFMLANFGTLAVLIAPKVWMLSLDWASPGGYEIWRKTKLDVLRAHQGLFTFRGMLAQPVTFCQAVILSHVLRVVELSQHGTVYYPLLAYGFYIMAGPWFMGRFVRGEGGTYGLFFLYGIWMDGHFIKTMEGWWFGIFDIIFLYFPLAILLSHRYSSSPIVSSIPGWNFSFVTALRVLVVLGILNQLNTVRNLILWYDITAGLVSPTKLWWTLGVIYWAFWKAPVSKHVHMS